jgi:imidazole glycerol-phosphate synthase subunit HisF
MMRRVRVIPSLLMQRGGLVKSVKFGDFKYVGDPINAVKIFNEKEVDEILILDISATKEGSGPDFARISELTSEAFMPLGYGGGITHLQEIQKLINIGVEKVVINSAAYHTPKLIASGVEYVGSQSIVISIDVKKNWLGKYKVFINNGRKNTGLDPIEYARKMERLGAGEILLGSIDRDGTLEGYDHELLRGVAEAVSLPVVAVGGAGGLHHFADAVKNGASAVAAGSFFVFQQPHRAVLISYPSQKEIHQSLFSKFG